jgi:hypothetical protein
MWHILRAKACKICPDALPPQEFRKVRLLVTSYLKWMRGVLQLFAIDDDAFQIDFDISQSG